MINFLFSGVIITKLMSFYAIIKVLTDTYSNVWDRLSLWNLNNY